MLFTLFGGVAAELVPIVQHIAPRKMVDSFFIILFSLTKNKLPCALNHGTCENRMQQINTYNDAMSFFDTCPEIEDILANQAGLLTYLLLKAAFPTVLSVANLAKKLLNQRFNRELQ